MAFKNLSGVLERCIKRNPVFELNFRVNKAFDLGNEGGQEPKKVLWRADKLAKLRNHLGNLGKSRVISVREVTKYQDDVINSIFIAFRDCFLKGSYDLIGSRWDGYDSVSGNGLTSS